MIYAINRPVTPGWHAGLLNPSTPGGRRPFGSSRATAETPAHANLPAMARKGEVPAGAACRLTGVACLSCRSGRCLRADLRRRGIGRGLRRTLLEAAPCRIGLPAAAKPMDDCPRTGFARRPSAGAILHGELR